MFKNILPFFEFLNSNKTFKRKFNLELNYIRLYNYIKSNYNSYNNIFCLKRCF